MAFYKRLREEAFFLVHTPLLHGEPKIFILVAISSWLKRATTAWLYKTLIMSDMHLLVILSKLIEARHLKAI
jgi:hypothetical protein